MASEKGYQGPPQGPDEDEWDDEMKLRTARYRTIIYSAGIITKRIASPRHLIDTLTVTCETMPNIFFRIPVIPLTMPWGPILSLFLLHPQVLWHMLLAANSAQSLAASESLGRPSCRFQVVAKCLQVEDTCKSKHSEGVKSHSKRKSVHISPVNMLLINPFVRQIFLQALCNKASHDDLEKLVQINIWATSGRMFKSRHNDILSISSTGWQLMHYLLSLKDIGVYFDISFDFDSPYRELSLGHRENLRRKKFKNDETLCSSEGRKSQAQGGSRFPFPGTWSRNLLIHEHDNKIIIVRECQTREWRNYETATAWNKEKSRKGKKEIKEAVVRCRHLDHGTHFASLISRKDSVRVTGVFRLHGLLGTRGSSPVSYGLMKMTAEMDEQHFIPLTDQWRLVPFPVAEMDRGVPMPQGTALIERRIELDHVTIIMFITRNNNMQAGPAVINSNGRVRFKKRIKKQRANIIDHTKVMNQYIAGNAFCLRAGYRPGLNYR
ncbi:hypothetical protein G5I_00334 [Acromyrmex echinatior]|uniref:Uncharacterized protein n=1 Tax=Acromyrmex echinatior TaxID=103372 RepID=F4W4L3_ACREC|nr:hypothetical protein G5I_00334 [Acromyrmex echinatior]